MLKSHSAKNLMIRQSIIPLEDNNYVAGLFKNFFFKFGEIISLY
jgi:hypothetical protein